MEATARPPIALVGLMGAGKSTVARLLGARLGGSVVDLDAELEQQEGATVGELFRDRGEAYFRRREGRLFEQALAASPAVIACGGGVVLAAGSRELLKTRCLTVWLEVDPDEAARRAANGGATRPLLEGDEPQARLESLLAERASLYAEVARVRIPTTRRTPDQVADEVLARLDART